MRQSLLVFSSYFVPFLPLWLRVGGDVYSLPSSNSIDSNREHMHHQHLIHPRFQK